MSKFFEPSSDRHLLFNVVTTRFRIIRRVHASDRSGMEKYVHLPFGSANSCNVSVRFPEFPMAKGRLPAFNRHAMPSGRISLLLTGADSIDALSITIRPRSAASIFASDSFCSGSRQKSNGPRIIATRPACLCLPSTSLHSIGISRTTWSPGRQLRSMTPNDPGLQAMFEGFPLTDILALLHQDGIRKF